MFLHGEISIASSGKESHLDLAYLLKLTWRECILWQLERVTEVLVKRQEVDAFALMQVVNLLLDSRGFVHEQ